MGGRGGVRGGGGGERHAHDAYLVIDHKLPPGRTGPDRERGHFSDAIVYVVGGGN